MLIECILVEINKTKLTTFDLKRNDALQNSLVQFLKYLAESLDILETQETMNVELFRPKNSYTHCIAMFIVVSFTLYLKGNGMKNSENGKY